uniref:Uncharacterized protein n=1 Tax=Rhizophora mucronata TaxID=61149 RepID=A0A2P2NY21_RHIMU
MAYANNSRGVCAWLNPVAFFPCSVDSAFHFGRCPRGVGSC